MKKYDVVVVGGGTAGCAAAYTAGKLGLKTLMIEKNIHLGGAITSGFVVPAMYSGENLINNEFYCDLISEMRSVGGQITYQDNAGWLNPVLLKIVLDKMMKNSNVDILFNTVVHDVEIKNCIIRNLIINRKILSAYNDKLQNDNEELFEPIEARYVIDATGNCEVGKICGCEFLENKNEIQPVSLRFVLSNVNLNAFSKWLLEFDKDREVSTVEHIGGNIHLSTAYTWDSNRQWALKPIFDKAVADGVLKDTDRNYFQIFTIAGMPNAVAFNCPRIPENIDALDVLERSKALIQAREAIYRLFIFCKKYLVGFENSYISNIADELGVRVSRRIKGKYIYTIEDLKSGKKFNNPVLISKYPVDIHSADKNSSRLEVVDEYSLPVESLMSYDIENLFVAGRCISCDFLSQGALRIQPSCFAMGEGVVKYIKSILK